jgi:hypothetical protein
MREVDWVAYDELRTYGAEPTEQRVACDGSSSVTPTASS